MPRNSRAKRSCSAPPRNSSISCSALRGRAAWTFPRSSTCTSSAEAAEDELMIECTIDGHVAQVTLANPPANAFTAEGLLRLTALVGEFDRNPAVRVVIVTGHGDKFFSGGADLKS